MPDAIKDIQNKTLSGELVTLVPYTSFYTQDVIKLRNSYVNSTSLLQQKKLTVVSQEKWFQEYLKRNNDVYWCVLEKQTKRMIATMSVYDISVENQTAELGRIAVKEDEELKTYYTIEAMILALRFAFEELRIKNIRGIVLLGNKNMLAVDKSVGFLDVGTTMKNGGKFHLLNMTPDSFNYEKMCKLLKYAAQ